VLQCSITRIFPTFNATGCRFPIVYEGLLSLYRRSNRGYGGREEEEEEEEGEDEEDKGKQDGRGGFRRTGTLSSLGELETRTSPEEDGCWRREQHAGCLEWVLAWLCATGVSRFLASGGGIWRSGVLSGWDCSLGCLDFWLGVVVIPLAAKGLLALGWISLESAQRRAPKP
jgi:hypothetical protein